MWILQNLSQVAVLALIVIFQPELRKILEKVVSLQGRKGGRAEDLHSHTVAASLFTCADLKRGAIIVYPGREPIISGLSGGHTLSAEISEPIIMSIFDPHSPGHDGAVIIEHNRLTRFGVRLPMSQTSRLAEEFGTRHHAAMGLAETTDALVLVVSEERGTVSAFKHATMTRLVSTEHTAALIRQQSAAFDVMKQSRLVLHDRRTVLQFTACLLLASLFWTAIAMTNRQIIERRQLSANCPMKRKSGLRDRNRCLMNVCWDSPRL